MMRVGIAADHGGFALKAKVQALETPRAAADVHSAIRARRHLAAAKPASGGRWAAQTRGERRDI